MQDYGSFCYLDVQKTGCSYVIEFLSKCSKIPIVKKNKHAPIEMDYDSRKTYFISVRHPLATYTSLYRFGCDGRGALMKRIVSRSGQNFYTNNESGFFKWLDFVIDSQNASLFEEEEFAPLANLGIGLVSFRFVKLSLASPSDKLSAVNTIEEFENIYKTHNIAKIILKNETLVSDLQEKLIPNLEEYLDTQKCRAFLGNSTRVNASKSTGINSKTILDYPSLKTLLEREQWLIRNFYS